MSYPTTRTTNRQYAVILAAMDAHPRTKTDRIVDARAAMREARHEAREAIRVHSQEAGRDMRFGGDE